MTKRARALPKCLSATVGMLALGLLHTFVLNLRAEPIRLHPGNPHYFLWRGQPAVLITAGEHYGAVLNRDFDHRRYLEELKRHSFNLTRVFSGTYREVPGSFNITGNTLAPAPGRFLCPWARSQTPGAADGENKFDLTKWDDNYFARLKDLIVHADQCGVVVELVFFCTMYDEKVWEASPIRLAPADAIIKERRIAGSPADNPQSPKATVPALAEAGQAYAIYVNGGARAELAIELPAGPYQAVWVNTKTGRVEKAETFKHAGGIRSFASPSYVEDIALRVTRERSRL